MLINECDLLLVLSLTIRMCAWTHTAVLLLLRRKGIKTSDGVND